MKPETIIGKESLGKGIRQADLKRAQAAGKNIVVQGLDGTELNIFISSRQISIMEGINYWFVASLSNDLLSLDIQNEVKGKKSHNLFPAQLMKFVFEEWGDRIKTVHGYWADGTNLNLYQEAIKAGKSPEDAALSTWTGQMVESLGFSEVIKIESSRFQVTVLFARALLAFSAE